MPAAPTIINFVHTDMDESMNNTSAIRSTAIEQITIHSSGSEMRVSDISIQSEFTGRRVGTDEIEPDRSMRIDPSPRRDRADFVDNPSPDRRDYHESFSDAQSDRSRTDEEVHDNLNVETPPPNIR
jgi:hypothetical protein